MGSALAKVCEEVDKDPVPQTLGAIFKTARTEQGKNLDAISEHLKIRRVFLQAIENEQFDILPGGVYTVGFIRSYAQYLGLDHDTIINQLKNESFFSPVRLASVGDEQHFPTTRFVPSNMVFIGLLLLVLCGISAYFFLEDAPIHINWPAGSKTAL
jgi:cytoskeletal protein RodZ